MANGTVFRRRAVSPEQVATAESAAAVAPIVGDPRMTPVTPSGPQPESTATVTTLYVLGQVYDVPLERIRSNPVNPRAVYTPQAVDDMAVSLQASGQHVAATGFVDGEEVLLIEGETRLRGARLAGLKTLRVEIKKQPESELELYKRARAANVERREQTALDDAIKWKELLGREVFSSQAALAQELGIKGGESTVSRTLQLANLSQPVVFALSEHPGLLTFQMLNAVRAYWEALGDEKTIEYIPLIEKNGWGYRKVAEDAANAQKGPVKRPRGSKEPLAYAGGKGEIKVFDGGRRLEVSLKGITDLEKAASFIEGLKALTR